MLSQQARQAVFQIYLPSLIMALGTGMIVPAVPLLGRTFGVSMGMAAQVVTAQVLGRAVSLIPSGMLLDRTGFRTGMMIGAAIAVASTAATAFAPVFWIILLSQFCWGVGLTLWRLGRELAAIDLVRVDQRGRQMSALFGIHASGTALGPAIGGIILDTWGFRSLFLIFAAMAGVVLVISATVEETHERGAASRREIFSFGRLNQIELYFRGTYLVLILATFGAMLRSEVLNSMLPIYVVDELGYSATHVGFLFFIIGAITFAMIVPAGVISDKYGRKWATVPPALLSGIGFALYPLAAGSAALVVLAVMLGIANGMALGSMTTYTYDIVPYRTRAQLQAMRRTVGETGAFVGPLLGGVIANVYGASVSFLFFAPLHLLAAFLLVFVAKESLPRRRK
ncbi:MAG: MFS transporter [Thermodesulfobacteriota bacterium]